MEIPKLLKNNSTKQIRKVKFEEEGSYSYEEERSYSYEELKTNVAQLENIKQSFKIDMLLASQLTEEIANRCEDILFDRACIINENELFFTYTQTIIDEIVNLMGEDSREYFNKMKNKKIPLGEVQFTRYSDGQKYQYLLSIEYVPDVKNMTSTKESIKWSKDEKSILSSYSVESSNYTYDTKFDFLEKDDKSKEMSMEGIFNTKFNDDIFNSNLKFKIVERGDADKTFDVTSSNKSSSNHSDEEQYSDSSIGYISNKGGSLLFISNNAGNIESKERESFDADGKVISRRYCDIYSSCDLNDESTWLDSNRDIFIGDPNSSHSLESTEILIQMFNLVGIPKSIVINICQDDNENGSCENKEPQAILTKDSQKTNETYLLENNNPNKPILMELQDKSKVNFDDGKFTFNFNKSKIEKIKELSILQTMVDNNIISSVEADTFRTLTNKEAQDKFYTALLDALENNINTFRNNGIDKQRVINVIIEKMGNKIKINQKQANKINACGTNKNCVDKEIKKILDIV
ncbi:hypothetical protein MNB_SV-14-1644 [hydrothermal vent metagenome]|uniref:Uncharacterized protein n=1 Tax=hydrothermal vent metagenome TaxID=652676 RepID=A0A1W1CTJ9_9ZZZZ